MSTLSPRRASTMLPTRCDIARPAESQAGSVVEDAYAVIVTGEPFDLQLRKGGTYSREYGFVASEKMKGYCDAAADVEERDRIIDGADTYLVTFMAVRGRRKQLDLETVIAS